MNAQAQPALSADSQILVVEDNELNRMVALGMLKKLGIRNVMIAENGLEALNKFEHNRFDVILMDMQMPVMDGYDAIRSIRERESADQRIPIIALTANAMQGDREKCLAAGADDYLSKPFTSKSLYSVLYQWLISDSSALPLRPLVQPLSVVQKTASHVKVDTTNSAASIDSADDVLDQSILEAIRDMQDEEDPYLLDEILSTFLTSSEQQQTELRTQITNNDVNGVRMAAHSLKGMSANIGATTFAQIVLELETLARSETLDGAEALYEEITREYVRVRNAVLAELPRKTA